MRTLFLLVLSVCVALSEDIYIAQNALGGEMSSAATATNLDWFNTAANWGSGAGKISAADTVHFVGTFTNEARCQASGTAGNLITLLAESGSKWILSGGVAASGINLSNFNYLLVDGGANAWIEYTDNGTLLAWQSSVHGIKMTPSIGNIEVRNWRMTNIFVFDTDSTGHTDYGAGVQVDGGSSTNISVHNITTHWAMKGVFFTYTGIGAHTWSAYSNVAQNCNWGEAGGDTTGGSGLFNLYIHHNQSAGHEVWNSPNNYYHENGSYFWAELGGGSSGSYISNSFFYANRRTCFGANQTGHIFTSASGGKGIINCNIYNNVIIGITPYGILVWKGVDARIFNNTFFSYPGGGDSIETAHILMSGTLLNYNNLFMAIGSPASIPDSVRAAGTPYASDYNSFFALNPFGGAWGDVAQYNYAQWTAIGYEAHSITANPLLVDTNAYDLHLLTNSPAIAAGTNLNVLGYPGIAVDFDGVTRPATAAWSIGAYEYVPPVVVPSPRVVNVSGTLRVGTMTVASP